MVKIAGTAGGIALMVWGYTGTIVTSHMSSAAETAVVRILKNNGMDPATIKEMQTDIDGLKQDVDQIKRKIGEVDVQTDGVKGDVKQLLRNQESQQKLVEKLLNKALGLPLDTPQ